MGGRGKRREEEGEIGEGRGKEGEEGVKEGRGRGVDSSRT